MPTGPPKCERFPLSPVCGCTVPCLRRLRDYEKSGVIVNPVPPPFEAVAAARHALPRCPREAVTILTWNVWFSHRWAGPRWEAILVQTGQLAPDIVCFQEATPAFVRNCSAQPWVRAGYATSDDDVGHGRSCAPEGELILVRIELQPHFSAHPLPASRQGRHLVLAELREGALAVATAHFESMENCAEQRAEQFRFAAQRLEGTHQADRKALCGDFNLFSDADDAALTAALGPAWADTWPTACPDAKGWTVDPARNRNLAASSEKSSEAIPPRRFDRVYTKGLAPERAELIGCQPLPELPSVWPSDHFGVLAELQGMPQI